MRGEFYTERDIVDLARRGERELRLQEGDRMTDLARERAEKEGLVIVGPYEIPEQAAREAGAKRYAVRGQGSAPPVQEIESTPSPSGPRPDVRRRVHRAVRDRLGDDIDPSLIDRVIDQVMDQMGLS